MGGKNPIMIDLGTNDGVALMPRWNPMEIYTSDLEINIWILIKLIDSATAASVPSVPVLLIH